MMILFLIGSFSILLFLIYRQMIWIYHSCSKRIFQGVALWSLLILLGLLIRFAFPFAQITQETIRTGVLLLSTIGLLWIVFLTIAGLFSYVVKTKLRKDVAVKSLLCIVLVLSISITFIGRKQALHIQTIAYDVTIDKPLKHELRFALISDTHIGSGFDRSSISELFTTLQQQNIDALLISGDLFDEATPLSEMEYFCEQSRRLHLKDGMFYVSGNHELLQPKQSTYETMLETCGYTILRDDYVLVDDAYYIAGRLDKKQKRADIKEITKGMDVQKPLIVLDHRPDYDKEGKGIIDVQLSGHTHQGQIFPNTLLTKIPYPHDYGVYKDPYLMIVSSGLGTWGFPIRLGSHSELVIVRIMN